MIRLVRYFWKENSKHLFFSPLICPPWKQKPSWQTLTPCQYLTIISMGLLTTNWYETWNCLMTLCCLTSMREESWVDVMECFFCDEPCGTFGFEASVNSLHLVNIKPGKNYQNSFYYQDIWVVENKHITRNVIISSNLKKIVFLNIKHNFPIHNEYQRQAAVGLAPPRKRAHQDDSNDTPQPTGESQVSFPLLRIRINQDKP